MGIELALGDVLLRADIGPGPEPASVTVDIRCFKGDDLVAAEEGPTEVDLPAPTVGTTAVADFPALGFAYVWGLLAGSVDLVSASGRCTVGSCRLVLADGLAVLVFVALVDGADQAGRRPARISLWTDGELVHELLLRSNRPASSAGPA